MPRLKHRIPAYRLHKARGYAVVTLDGKDRYLGTYGSPESRLKYDQLISDWLRNRAGLEPDPLPPGCEITIVELIAKYLEQISDYYRKPDGSQTSEVYLIRMGLKILEQMYSTSRAVEFGPLALKQVRDKMIRRGWTRKSINKHIMRIRGMFSWATENELIPGGVLHGLKAVKGLRKGRSQAKETARVTPVAIENVEAIKAFVSRQIWAMVQLQLLTGMRPGEVVQMRTCDLEKKERIWIYTPQSHKTEHYDKRRRIAIGPRAQKILKPFLKPNIQTFLFSPTDAEAERAAARHRKRKTPLERGNSPGTHRVKTPRRSPRETYTVGSYRKAVQRACRRADAWAKGARVIANEDVLVPIWHPHQLRHTAATHLRKEFGLDATRAILGHSSPVVTELYAELDQATASNVMEKIG